MTRKGNRVSCRDLFRQLGIMSLPCLIMYNSVKYVTTNRTLIVNRYKAKTPHNLRSKNISVKKCKTLKEQKYVAHFGVKIFNKFQNSNRSLKSIKSHFTHNVYYSFKEFLD